MRRARRGFTLLEMLAVISIILILVGLSVIAFETLDRTASGKQTRVMLNSCTAMLNEFENGSGGLSALGGPYSAGAGGPLGTSAANELTSMATAYNITTGVTYVFGRYGTDVQNTWYVMAYLMRNPKVKQMVQNMPANRVLTISKNGANVQWYPNFPSAPPTGYTANSGVVLLDGWGNPIIFVPSGGINVWKKGQPSATLIQSRDQQPFFASAGPDGDFGADYNSSAPLAQSNYTGADSWTSPATQMNITRTPMGDDNIYSFENGQ